MGLDIGGEIERVNGKELSYREFVERYLEKNQPVLISGLMDGWMASKDWVTENGSPNLAFFSIHCGESKVQVADCGRRDFTDQKRIEMSVSGFISHWQQLSAGKCRCDSSDKDNGRPLLYLKDWHFVKEDTISINHNWFNAYNLSWVWGLLLKDYNEAKEYIEDIRDICDDFESLCQRNLAANTGMNFFDFFVFITRFSFANLTLLYHLVKTDEHPISASSDTIQDLISNLTSIRNIALSMKNVETFAREDHSACSDLKTILEEPEFIELCAALSRTYTSTNGQLKEASGMDDKSIGMEFSSSYLDFLVAIGFEVNGPDDLIRITENAILSLGCKDNGWCFRLSPESDHIKPRAVL